MYTLPSGRIVNSLKILSVAQAERHKDREQPGLSSSISVAPASLAQHNEPEHEHRSISNFD